LVRASMLVWSACISSPRGHLLSPLPVVNPYPQQGLASRDPHKRRWKHDNIIVQLILLCY